MARLLHVSDTHLGYQAYTRLTPEGLNQREVDAQEAFRRVVDDALEDPPDVFLHTGDLFEHPRPTNRAIAFALQQVRRLSEARIPTVLVSGNHDAPRMRETGSIFRVFEGLPHIHPVYAAGYEAIRVGGVVLHAVPQALTQDAFQTQLAAAAPTGPGPHVLAVHGSVLGVDGLFTSEFNEYQIPYGFLRSEFDYVALGHFHNTRQVAPNAWYAGSTEAFSFHEADQAKGYLRVDVEPGRARAEARPCGARPMVDLAAVEGEGLDAGGLHAAAVSRLDAAPRESVARLTIERVERGAARAVDWDGVRGARPDLVHLDLRLRILDDGHAVDGALELHPLAEEFEAFLARYPLRGDDRNRVREAALRCLADAGGGAGAA